jgi:CDP-diacylglycerol--serine O-phosphatidyltransferase
MIRQLADPANAITATGLILSVMGIYLAASGRTELAVAVVLWALLADHLDGVVAARTQGRSPETGKIGKSLDSLADLVSAAVFPAVVLVQVSAGSLMSAFVGSILVVASALRLSYFNTFGLSDGQFVGVPTTYAVPLTAVLFLARPLLPAGGFPELLGGALLLLAVAHVLPVRIPRTEGYMYAVIVSYVVVASGVLAARDLI